MLIFASVLTNFLGLVVQPVRASGSSSSSESASSSQPLWSYQVKPNSYVGGQPGHYSATPSLFDAFNGLSQRQGALSGSPFLSILPIILIAAGGLLLLLPMLTMMMASPFGAGFGGGYQNLGYPQVGALNKRRSLDSTTLFGNQRGLIDLVEHVSTTIEELTKKYSNPSVTAATTTTTNNNGQQQANNNNNKRAKSLNSQVNESQAQPANHKSSDELSNSSNNLIVGL